MHTTSAPSHAASTLGASVAPVASASAAARSVPRLQTRISGVSSTERIASTCERACTPAPRMATTLEPGRASSRVATAETAAVLISVIADAFSSAVS